MSWLACLDCLYLVNRTPSLPLSSSTCTDNDAHHYTTRWGKQEKIPKKSLYFFWGCNLWLAYVYVQCPGAPKLCIFHRISICFHLHLVNQQKGWWVRVSWLVVKAYLLEFIEGFSILFFEWTSWMSCHSRSLIPPLFSKWNCTIISNHHHLEWSTYGSIYQIFGKWIAPSCHS